MQTQTAFATKQRVGDAILRDILIIFAVAVPVVLLAHRLKFPAIVGFLVTGFLIGPNVLRFVPDIEEIRVLADVGVAMLLFSIGLEFSFARFKDWGRSIIAIGVVQVVVTSLVGIAVSRFIGCNFSESVFLSFSIALSSTAIVLAILSQKRWFDAPAGRMATGILILQDLAVIPMMVFLKVFAMNQAPGISQDVTYAVVKLAALVGVFVVLAKWVLTPILHHTSLLRSKELFVVVIVGLAMASAYATEQMGFSFALGAFLAGLLVSTTEFRFHALSEIAPFRYCFNGLFFVSVGMIVDPTFIMENLGDVASLILFIVVLKILVVATTVRLFGYPLSVAVICALMLAQVGEFSFMLVFFGWKAGAIGFNLYQLIVDASAITMVIAPFFVLLAPKVGEKISSSKSKRCRCETIPQANPEMSNHAIICGFGPLGMTIGGLLEKNNVPYVVLELNPATAMRYKQEGKTVYVGDGASAALLYHSGIGRARLLAIAVPDHLNAISILKQARIMSPSLYIIVRSRYRNQVENMYEAGADVVICEELEAGIEMGRYILGKLGVAEVEAEKIVKEIRAFGSADFF